MIEEWNLSTMYEGYYNQCRPAQCTYTYETRNDAIHIVTTLIGIVGGLVSVLRFIVPRVIIFLRRKKREQERPANGKQFIIAYILGTGGVRITKYCCASHNS